MVEPARRATLRDRQEPFTPDNDALTVSAAETPAGHALDYIAFQIGRIEENLAKMAAAIQAALARD